MALRLSPYNASLDYSQGFVVVMFSPHFSVSELACPTTGEIVLENGFIDELEALRAAYGKPMAVTSGCRSSEHNAWLRERGYSASPNSLHLMQNNKYGTHTCAVDIKRPDGRSLHTLLAAATGAGWTIGLASTFVHLDMRGKYTSLKPIIYLY